MTRTAPTNNGPTTPAVVLDLPTVVAVLYIAPFTPAEWELLGMAELARFVTKVAADPVTRIPDVLTVLAGVPRDHLPREVAEQLAAAEEVAPAVLAAAAAGAR